jgi:hypothetical protein
VQKEIVCTLLTLFIVLDGVRLNIEDALRTRALNSHLPGSEEIGTCTSPHNAKFSVSEFHCSAVDDILLLGRQIGPCVRKATSWLRWE